MSIEALTPNQDNKYVDANKSIAERHTQINQLREAIQKALYDKNIDELEKAIENSKNFRGVLY